MDGEASDQLTKVVIETLVNSSKTMAVTVEVTTVMVAMLEHPQWAPDGTTPCLYTPC